MGQELSRIRSDPTHLKKLYLPLIGLKVNTYSCVAENSKNELKVFWRDSGYRRRPETTQKDSALMIKVKDDNSKSTFSSIPGEYGERWSQKY